MIFVSFSVFAQTRESDISISIIPLYPSSNESVKASLTSQVVDLTKALISWSINGEEKLHGVGKETFQFNTGVNETSINISASINLPNGRNLIKNIIVRPSEVDMLWEAVDSYTPPFYKGKALVSSQGKVKVVAIPSFGEQSKGKNLSYTWSKDSKSQPQFSGWGKNYITFQNSYLDTINEVSVKISDLLGKTSGSGSLSLTVTKPKILFYKYDTLLGVEWTKTLENGFFVSSAGESIVAEPYFFSEDNINSSNLSFEWFINGQKTDTQEIKNILSVRLENDSHGSAVIKTTVENTDTLFQEAENQVRINF
jgi:hypothetical protein